MMEYQPYWITEKLAIVPRPNGGRKLDDEMAAMREAGIDVVVSMLEAGEAKDLGLQDEEPAAMRAGMRFIGFPVPDRGTPTDVKQFGLLLTALEKTMNEGRRVGVHCRACIGRSTVVVASLLVRSGLRDTEAWRQIRDARGTSVPDTAEQREWVQEQIRQKPWHLL